MIAFGAIGCLTTWLVACGGEVRTDDPDAPAATSSAKEDDPPSATGGKSGGTGSGSSSHLPETQLDECKKGTLRADADHCVYLYEGRCYDEKLDACACACKKQSGTICSSGFPNPDVPTEVSCF